MDLGWPPTPGLWEVRDATKEAEHQRRDFFGGSYAVVSTPISHGGGMRKSLFPNKLGCQRSLVSWICDPLKSGRWCLTPMRESKGHQAGWCGLYCRPKGRLQLGPGNLHSGRYHGCARQGRRDTTVPGTSRWGSPVEPCPPKLKLSTPW